MYVWMYVCMYVHIHRYCIVLNFSFEKVLRFTVPKNHPTQCKKSSFMNDEMNVVECKLPKQYIPTNNVSWNDASLDSTFRQTLFHIVPRCTNALHIRRVHWLPQDASTVARGGRDQYVWDGDIDAQDPTIMGFDNVLSIKIISKNVVHDNFFIVSYTE